MEREVEITAGDVRALRERTGQGLQDCLEALKKYGGDMEAAAAWLQGPRRERVGWGEIAELREMIASLSQRVEKLESLGSPKDAHSHLSAEGSQEGRIRVLG
jgi:hypothetical protein